MSEPKGTYKTVDLKKKEEIEFYLRNLVARILMDCARIEYEGQYENEIVAIADTLTSQEVKFK